MYLIQGGLNTKKIFRLKNPDTYRWDVKQETTPAKPTGYVNA